MDLKDSSAVEDFSGLKFPKDTVEWALFEGTEQEGPFKGERTLFVVGFAPYADILSRLEANENSTQEYTQVYFGAGGRFDYNSDTVRAISNYVDTYKVAITVENPDIDFDLMYSCSELNWMCPVLWHGQLVQEGADSMSEARNHPDPAERIIVKVDTGSFVLSTWARDCTASTYADYSEDRLLTQKEKQ
jgi:hypothetical protein